MKITKRNPLQSIVNDFQIDSPAAINISYFWSFGSLLGQNQVQMQITGIQQAMHYTANTALAFNSVEHIMRDVNNGWQQRYFHANGASFFFIWVYLHIGRGQYYGSYRKPRSQLWIIGVIIFIQMMATAFIGYVQPWGQSAQNEIIIANDSQGSWLGYMAFGASKIPSKNRIGPHNIDLQSVLIGNLLGDGHGKQRNGNPRFTQHMSKSNMEYLYWQHGFYSERGYSSIIKPNIKPQAPKKKSKIYYSGKLNLYTFSSQRWVYDMFYNDKKVKIIPLNIADYQNPLSQAIWYMDNGERYKNGGKYSTNNFTYDEHIILQKAIKDKFGLNVRIDKRPFGYIQIIPRSEYALFIRIISPYIIGGMQKKISQ